MDLMTKLLKSRTIVFNVAVVLAAVMTLLLNHEAIQQYPQVVAYLAAGAGAVNVVLRFLTATSLFGKLDEIKVPKIDKK